MTKQPERIDSICQHNQILSKISQHAQLLEHLGHIFQQILPIQFSAHCRLANINGETLIIHTDNASFASLIRFQAPSLCKTLSSELNMTIKHIEVKVKPCYVPFQDHTTHNTLSLPKSAATALQQTAQTMDDSPLKAALEKLAKRSL